MSLTGTSAWQWISTDQRNYGDYMTDKAKELNETPYGQLPTGVKTNGCDAWRRAHCLEARLDVDPESLIVEGRKDILRCPVCQHTIALEVPLE